MVLEKLNCKLLHFSVTWFQTYVCQMKKQSEDLTSTMAIWLIIPEQGAFVHKMTNLSTTPASSIIGWWAVR